MQRVHVYPSFFAILVLVEIVFTIGEMMNGPNIQKAVSLMAPAEMRGRYFSIFSLSWQVSRGIGPLLGGLVLEHYSGEALFAGLGVLLLFSGLAQQRLIRKVQSSQAGIAVRSVSAAVQS